MKFTTSIFNAAMTASIVFTSTYALPVSTRDVFVPPVLTPAEGAVWPIGSTQTVTWDVTNPPKQITNPVGRILLRQGGLTTNITLASGFDILLGTIDVTVPDVTPDSDYAIVLFGDSGNFSPDFIISPPN
ncbi:hypothetical protein BDN72DRAFT_516476 [Pluteus cervinus]|uniref:Uncharacterized protein n=1 Tax=Pluteus cervinus TaxID=181527 RepID=A0ACD3BBE7_9AGAR|nr:hypothetical protein BDN72DRAFT_516476 [Pluteus cervinus]